MGRSDMFHKGHFCDFPETRFEHSGFVSFFEIVIRGLGEG